MRVLSLQEGEQDEKIEEIRRSISRKRGEIRRNIFRIVTKNTINFSKPLKYECGKITLLF
jgi:hypothetical protein